MSNFAQSLHKLVDVAWLYLVHATWQSAVVGIVLLALVLVGRRWPAPLRYALLVLALGKFFIPPFLALSCGVFSWLSPQIEAPRPDPQVVEIKSPTTYVSALQVTGPNQRANQSDEPSNRAEAKTSSAGDLVALPDLRVRKSPAAPATRLSTSESSARPTAPARSQAPPVSLWPSVSVIDRIKISVLTAWLLGAVLVIIWLIDQQRRLSRILQHAPPSTNVALCARLQRLATALQVRRCPQLRQLASPSGPFACGLRRPKIVLSDDLIRDLSGEQLDVVLAHELAHHRRGDLWVNALQTVAFAAFWFHPVYWWLNRALGQVREECCDDLLLARGLMSGELGCETLLTVARRGTPPRELKLRISMAHPLASRLKRLLDDSRHPSTRLSIAGWIVVVAIAVLVLPGVRRFTGSQALAMSSYDAAREETDTELTEISGTVTEEGGAPVSDADIYVVRSNPFATRTDDRTTVVRQCRTDGRGRYQISAELKDLQGPLQWGFDVWAIKGDHSVAFAHASPGLLHVSLNLHLSRTTADFSILGADGRPVAGATVWPMFIGSGGDVPATLRTRLSRRTDANGRVSLPVDGRKNVHSLTIEAVSFGTQYTSFADRRRMSTAPPSVISLGPVGKVVGRVVSDNPAAAADLEVRIFTNPSDSEPYSYRQSGLFTTRTNNQGQFEVPAIRAGAIRITVAENPHFALLATPTNDVLAAPGQVTTIKVPLRKATRLSGRALDRNTKRPVADVVVVWNRDAGEVSTKSNENGEYSLLTFPGSMSLRIFPPLPYVALADSQRLTIRNADSVKLPDLPLTRGYSLKGQTADANGSPQSGIRLEASWSEDESPNTPWGQSHQRVARNAESDDAGHFTIRAVPPDREVRLAARKRGVDVASPVTLESPPREPLKLTVRALEMIHLSGTVVDSHRRPVPNAVAQIEMQTEASPNTREVGVVDKATTDAQGHFRSTKTFDREGLYRAQVRIAGEKVAESEWITPVATPANAFPVLVTGEQLHSSVVTTQTQTLEQPRTHHESRHLEMATLNGIVVDSHGRAVPDATVIVWSMAERTQQKTTSQGRFSWPTLPRDGVFLFVDAKGFRFHGQWVQPGPEVRIAMIRKSEPALSLRPLDDPPSSKGILDRAWRAFRPTRDELLEKFAAQGTLTGKSYNTDAFSDLNFADLYVQFDSRHAVEFFSSHRPKDRFLLDHIHTEVANNVVATDPDGALRQIGQISGMRGDMALCELAVDSESLGTARRHQILDQLRTKNNSRPGGPDAESLLFLARSYRRIGDSKTAAELLTVAKEKLPAATGAQGRGPFVRGWFAIEKAILDGTDTTGLLAPARNEREYNRFHGAIARAIAARDPEAAERIAQTLQGDPGLWTAKICQEMAKADPSRAEHLALTAAEPVYQAYALGCVAVTTFSKDSTTAHRLIDNAYAILQECADSEHRGSRLMQTPASVAIALLEYVEQIDPTLIDECLWHAISLRSHITFGKLSMSLGPFGDGGRMRLSDPVLSACVARYDLETAKHILRPPGDESVDEGVSEYPYFYFFTAAILDAVGTIDTAARLPRATPSQHVANERAWRELFASLTHHGNDRLAWLREKQLFLWKAGNDDF